VETVARVLIAEDELIVAWAMRAALRRRGIETTSLEREGSTAIAAFDRDRPDLALLDIYLADATDGIEVARHIRESSNVPFIFVTASQDAPTRERALAQKPAAIVPKPFDDGALADAIMRALGRAEARPGTA
jgi:CheY-like chemotaxis protein